MNRFWIAVVVLLLVNLTISDPVKADGALKNVRIFNGINPIRPPNTPHTIPRRYVWSFESRYYTAIMGIDQKRYSSYLSRRSRNPKDLSEMVEEGTDALQDLVREFHKMIPQHWTAKKKVNFVLAFVQHLPYVPDKEMTKHDEFFKHALETLVERGGDCEDTSVLSASILNGMGFELVLIWPKGHIAIGVKGNFSGYYYPYKRSAYYFCETTGRGWKLGDLPPDIPKYANVIPITPKAVPSRPEKAMPIVPTQPTPPRSNLSSISLVKGINQYETELEFEKAIVSFKYALDQGDLDSQQHALAHLYWGCSELGRTNQTEPNYNYYVDKAEEQFSKAFRHNPNQELPPRLKSKRKISTIFEQARKESIGELTISASPSQTEIRISGNGINRKDLGTGIKPINLRLFKGNYTVEGIYAGRPIKRTIYIQPDTHQSLKIEIQSLPPTDDIPPKIELVDPGRTAHVDQEIQVMAEVTDNISVKSVYLSYAFSRSGTEPSKYNRISLTNILDRYFGDIPSQSEVGYIWYYLIATDTEGNEGKTKKRRLEIKPSHRETPPDNQPPTIELLSPPRVTDLNQPIRITAKVTDDIAIESVYLFYHLSNSSRSRPSGYDRVVLKTIIADRYFGDIPSQSEVGYIWYYLTATDIEGNNTHSEVRKIRIKRDRPDTPSQEQPEKPFIAPTNEPIAHQGIWVNYAWSSRVFEEGASLLDGNRGDSINLTYLHEGKNYQTFGVQLDYSYQNLSNMSATFQWAPTLEESSIAFTLFGGVAGYSNFDSTKTSLTLSRQVPGEPIYITPILGLGLKLYPLNRVSMEAIGSIKLPSNFDNTYLYHYEIGTRIYINDLLNLKLGYSQFYLGSGNIQRMQIGLGFTF